MWLSKLIVGLIYNHSTMVNVYIVITSSRLMTAEGQQDMVQHELWLIS